MTKTEDTLEINEDLNDSSSGHYDTRESILNRLDEVIQVIHKKALKGRVNKPENEKVRIQWFRVLAYTCSIYNQIKKDAEIYELNQKSKT